MTTGQRIRAARKAANMTQAELAQKLGIPFQSISQWERDIRNPKKETLIRIADALGVSISDLCDFSLQAERDKIKEEISEITSKLNTATEEERNELEYALGVLEESCDDIDFIAAIQPYLSDLEPLSDDEAALKTLLNSIGFDIIKTRGNYFFTHEHGGSGIFTSEISTDDLNELLSCAQNGLKIAAKTLELKLMRKAFGPHYPAKIIIPPPSAPQADTDTTNEEPTPEDE